VVDPARQGVAAQVKDGVLKAVGVLADAGYVVDEAEPPSVDLAAKTALEMLAVDSAAGIELMTMYPPEIQSVLRALIELAGHPDHMKGCSPTWRQSLMRAWGEFQQEHPVILAPISTDIPFEAAKGYSPAEVAEIVRNLRMTTAINALGRPAVALPVGVSKGLPQAVQLIGPRFREDLCLDAAAALEERVGIITPIDPHP